MEFEPGQVWTYDARPGEESSRVVICRVDHDARLGEIVHIHVRGLRVSNQRAPGGVSHEIGHLPYDAAALRSSLASLEATEADLPRYEEGHEEWRQAFDAGKAGVWTIPVREAIVLMESILSS